MLRIGATEDVDTTDPFGGYTGLAGGRAFFRSASQKTYLTVKPKSGVEAADTSSTWIWALGAAATVIIVLVVVILMRRGRRAVEEARGAGRPAPPLGPESRPHRFGRRDRCRRVTQSWLKAGPRAYG